MKMNAEFATPATVAAEAGHMDGGHIVERLRGRARYCKDIGSEKSASLMYEAANEIERLRIENIQLLFACGYPMPAELEKHIIPHNPFQCGICDARNRRVAAVNDEREFPLMLSEAFAQKVPGVTLEMIEAAKLSPQPCPDSWPVPQRTWMVTQPIPPMSASQ